MEELTGARAVGESARGARGPPAAHKIVDDQLLARVVSDLVCELDVPFKALRVVEEPLRRPRHLRPHELAALDPLAPDMGNLHVQILCRVTTSDGERGMGTFEQLVLGPYDPWGLTGHVDTPVSS